MQSLSEQKSKISGTDVVDRQDRIDVPSEALCRVAYKIAKAGDSFTKYAPDIRNMRASGCDVPTSRNSREICKRLVSCFAHLLREDDKKLLQKATDISVSMDGRKGCQLGSSSR